MNLTNAAYIFLCIYSISIVVEIIISIRSDRALYNLKDSLVNLMLGVMAIVIRLATKGSWLALWLYLYQFTPFKLGNSAGTWLMLFLANEFVYYWFHRLSHENRLLWAVHVNHHSSEKLNFTTAARVPLLNFILHNVFWIPLVLIGFDPLMIFTVESIGFLFAFYQHTQVIGKMRVVDWVLNTPSHHRVHHASNPAYRNKNYGNVLIIFDRIFGTFKAEDEKIKPVYGLEENLKTYNLLVVVFHEWAALWQQKKIDTTRVIKIVRNIVIAALLTAAAYHLMQFALMGDKAGSVRHLLFAAIDVFSAFGIRKPFQFFPIFFAAFTLQQYWSHGIELIDAWSDDKGVDWVSVGVLVVMPSGLWTLLTHPKRLVQVQPKR